MQLSLVKDGGYNGRAIHGRRPVKLNKFCLSTPPAHTTARAAARPAARPEKMQPPRKVPSSAE
jgi:hypothetical protein